MSKAKPVPEGYGTVTPALNIEGAADAIEFYKKAFGAEERARMPGPDGTIMHAEIRVGSSIVMLSDAVRQAPTQASLHLYVEDADKLWARATSAGATVVMPLSDQFWGDRYGVLSDKWGNRWSIATHKEDIPRAEMEQRAAQAMSQSGRSAQAKGSHA